jgi:Ras-related protein Rab-11A
MDSTHLVKAIIMGDCLVGKTSLIHRLCCNEFSRNQAPTMGVDFTTRTRVSSLQRTYKIQFWDLSGSPRFTSTHSMYLAGGLVFIIAFDMSKRETYTHVEQWMDQLHWSIPEGRSEYSTPFNANAIVFLVATKHDLNHMRVVSEEEASNFADRHGMLYYETSASDGFQIQDFILTMVDAIDDKDTGLVGITHILELQEDSAEASEDEIIFYNYVNSSKKKRCCCL